MSVLRMLAGRRFWVGQLWTIAVALAVTAVGALVVTLGVIPVDRAWIWIGVSWCAAGLCGGRCNASGERDALIVSVINVLVAMGILWLIGLTTPGKMSGEIQRWPYYIGAALMGALVPVWPQKRRRHKKGRGKGKQRLK